MIRRVEKVARDLATVGYAVAFTTAVWWAWWGLPLAVAAVMSVSPFDHERKKP